MKYYLILFFILHSICPASNKDNLDKGRNLFYNLQFDKAEKYFELAIKNEPSNPKPWYYISQIYLWSFLGSKDTTEFRKFMETSDSTITVLENSDFFGDSNYLQNYWSGNAYSARAIALSAHGDMMSAFWSTKKAVGFYEDVLEENENFYDAYLGLGIFEYALDFVPPIFKWALDLTGLTADRKSGFLKIKKANEFGNGTKTEAAFHLGKLYIEYLADFVKAEKLFDELLKQYPQNSLFLFHLALAQFNNVELSGAQESLDKILKLNNRYFAQTNSFAYFLKGDIAFKQNRFDEAVNLYQKFLENAVAIDYTGIACLRIALSYKFLKNEGEYKKYLFLAGNGNLDIPEDNYAKEISEKYLDSDLTNKELKIIKAQNFLFTKEYQKSVDLLQNLIPQINDPDWKGKALITLAEDYMNMKKYNDAFNLCSQAISTDYRIEKWILPYSYYLKAMLYYHKGRPNEAKSYLAKAEEENRYFMKNKILAKINNLKKKLGIF